MIDVDRAFDQATDREVGDVQRATAPGCRQPIGVEIIGLHEVIDHAAIQRAGRRKLAAYFAEVVAFVGDGRLVGHAIERNDIVAADQHKIGGAGVVLGHRRVENVPDLLGDFVGIQRLRRIRVPLGVQVGQVAEGRGVERVILAAQVER